MPATANRYTDLDDDALFVCVRNGEEAAFRELYRRYKHRIFAYCLRIVRDRHLAEDVFQQTFLSVFEHRDQYTGGNLAGWIYTIARNWAFKAKQRQNRIHTHEIHDMEAEIDNLPYNPYPSPETQADYAILLDHIAQLPEEYREALELRYIDELPYKDIADILGISESLAKVRVFRAKKLLQKKLRLTKSESTQ